MSITRARTSSVAQGPSTKKTLLGGNDVILGGSYDAIGTVDVGSGGTSTISFTSIPGTYKHLQIRGIMRSANSANNPLRFNSDSGSNYTWHQLQGDGSSASTYANTPVNGVRWGLNSGDSSYPFATIIDILDYANTNKYKTVRALSGNDGTGTTSSRIGLYSGVWMNTNAITSIAITNDGNTMLQYSQFDLYGIK
jgi:hypothetical protein